MTPVTPIQGTLAAALDAARHEPVQPAAAQAAPPETGRALISLQAAAPTDRSVQARSQANFIAHLIATDQKLPQTRERRRAEPREATSAYAAAGAGPVAVAGRSFSRAI